MDIRTTSSGGGGIRTPEASRPAGFQDRCNQPGSATPPSTQVAFLYLYAFTRAVGDSFAVALNLGWSQTALLEAVSI